MRHIIPISGKDSLATAYFQTARSPGLNLEYFFCDTEQELPETYAWLDRVEEETGWEIQRVGRNLADRIEEYGGFLPGFNSRYCTRESKIEPMEKWIGESEATIYYGIRADEDRVGYVAKDDNITPAYPLKEMGIDLKGVWTILKAQDLLPPSFFWPALHARVEDIIGQETEWGHLLKPWERQLLFDGRSRSNCFFCWGQRLYEWTWLFDTHPDLFEEAKAYESEDYTWNAGYSLDEIAEKRDETIDKRAREVAGKIASKREHDLFGGEPDLLTGSHCGAFCGK